MPSVESDVRLSPVDEPGEVEGRSAFPGADKSQQQETTDEAASDVAGVPMGIVVVWCDCQ